MSREKKGEYRNYFKCHIINSFFTFAGFEHGFEPFLLVITDVYRKYPISSNYEEWYGKGFTYAQSVVREKLEDESAIKSMQQTANVTAN